LKGRLSKRSSENGQEELVAGAAAAAKGAAAAAKGAAAAAKGLAAAVEGLAAAVEGPAAASEGASGGNVVSNRLAKSAMLRGAMLGLADCPNHQRCAI
jgi:hypothetical protein